MSPRFNHHQSDWLDWYHYRCCNAEQRSYRSVWCEIKPTTADKMISEGLNGCLPRLISGANADVDRMEKHHFVIINQTELSSRCVYPSQPDQFISRTLVQTWVIKLLLNEAHETK